ncbi:MAG: PQQ-binding-like beta-propeller repeat protein [Planctomycetota bacterium]|nr:PQQ-binding-like beta-propeller repeat protein [Planctomycetota bacterium]
MRRLVITSVLVLLCSFVALSSAPAEDENKRIFIDSMADEGIALLEKLRAAVKAGKARSAATILQRLFEEYSSTLVKTEEGAFVSVRGVALQVFSALAKKGVKAFQDQFDRAARVLAQDMSPTDPAPARHIITAYPLTTYAAKALCLLGAVHADRGEYAAAASHLEELSARFPYYFSSDKVNFALLALCYARLGNQKGIMALAERARAASLEDEKFSEGTLGSYIERMRKLASSSQTSSQTYPMGDTASRQRRSCDVEQPVLLWKAPVSFTAANQKSVFERSYEPFLHARSRMDVPVYSRPVILNDRIYVTDGFRAYCRDLSTGVPLNAFPSDRDAADLASIANVSVPTVLSLSASEQVLYFLSASTSSSYFSTRRHPEAFSVVDGAKVFDSLDVLSGSNPEELGSAATVNACSPPVAISGNVYYLATADSGMTDVYAIALDASTGRQIWSRSLFSYTGERASRGPGMTLLSYSDGDLFISMQGVTCAINAASGDIRWLTTYEVRNAGNGAIQAPVVFAQYDVLLCSPADCAKITAHSVETGRILWEEALNASYIGYEGSVAYFESASDGIVYGIDVKSGERISTVNAGGLSEGLAPSLAAVADGRLYIPVPGGLKVADLSTGAGIVEFMLRGGTAYMGTAVAAGSYVVCATPEMLYCFADGKRLTTSIHDALEDNPGDPVANYRLGVLEHNSSNLVEALNLFKKSLENANSEKLNGQPVAELARVRLISVYQNLAANSLNDAEKVLEYSEAGLKLTRKGEHVAQLLQMRAGALLFLDRNADAVRALGELMMQPLSQEDIHKALYVALNERGVNVQKRDRHSEFLSSRCS